jgi:hypothetical protein
MASHTVSYLRASTAPGQTTVKKGQTALNPAAHAQQQQHTHLLSKLSYGSAPCESSNCTQPTLPCSIAQPSGDQFTMPGRGKGRRGSSSLSSIRRARRSRQHRWHPTRAGPWPGTYEANTSRVLAVNAVTLGPHTGSDWDRLSATDNESHCFSPSPTTHPPLHPQLPQLANPTTPLPTPRTQNSR